MELDDDEVFGTILQLEELLEEEGHVMYPWQRKVLEALLEGDREGVEEAAWYEPPKPVVPPSNWTKLKRWFNRVVLRRKHGISLSNFDAALRDIYAPGLRAAINEQSPLMAMIAKSSAKKDGIKGQHAVWTIVDEVAPWTPLEGDLGDG